MERKECSTAHLHSIYSHISQPSRIFFCNLGGYPFFGCEVVRVYFNQNRHCIRYDLPGFLNDLFHDSKSSLVRATPGILSSVEERREELAEEIAMGSMQLNCIGASFRSTSGCLREGLYRFLNLQLSHL